jgi:hypothetical protein
MFVGFGNELRNKDDLNVKGTGFKLKNTENIATEERKMNDRDGPMFTESKRKQNMSH